MTTHWWTCHNWDKSGSGEAQGGQVWPYGSGKAFPLQGKPSQVRREEAGQASHREMGQTQEGFGRHQRASEILAPRKEAVHVSACITNYCQYVYNTVCVFTCVQPLYMTLTDSDGILLFFCGFGVLLCICRGPVFPAQHRTKGSDLSSSCCFTGTLKKSWSCQTPSCWTFSLQRKNINVSGSLALLENKTKAWILLEPRLPYTHTQAAASALCRFLLGGSVTDEALTSVCILLLTACCQGQVLFLISYMLDLNQIDFHFYCAFAASVKVIR